MKHYQRLGAALAAALFALTACGGGGGGGSASPTPTPAPSPANAAEDCPTTGNLPTSVAVHAPSGAAVHIHAAPRNSKGAARYVPDLLVVSYAPSVPHGTIEAAAGEYAVNVGHEINFGTGGILARTVSVDPNHVDDAIAQLRKVSGVIRVDRAQYRRHFSVVTPDDPYYDGFGPGAPYYESATLPGQWDMWDINVGGAWGSLSSIQFKGAPIAVVDTGVDVTHPEMANGKITRTQCYVTYPTSASQSSGPYVTDTDGHGTNVAGIADSDTNNNLGFVGVGYNAPLLAYRIFPTDPSGGCDASQNSNSPECESTDVDEISAINDAVAHGAKVINLSLGAPGPLSQCQDQIEETAVENAIKAGVVVVAAAGNDSQGSLSCPAAYPGVIAVGATGLNDAVSPIKETVASYSDYSNTGPQTGGGAYLVAPGGNASSGNDSDNLHWITNIYSSTAADLNGQGCGTDFLGQNDCTVQIAGTSQATPHVTGVVSLMLGITPSLTPGQIAQDLCSTADSIGDAKQGCGRVDAAKAVSLAATQ